MVILSLNHGLRGRTGCLYTFDHASPTSEQELSMVIYVRLLILGLLTPCLVAGSINAAAEDLFPDKNLEAAVRRYVFAKRNNSEALVGDDVQSLSTIVAKGKGITNLKGIEACASLALLDVAGNEIRDAAPLRELRLLQSLDLSGNNIQDISPLAGLTGLQYLHLADNQIADLLPVAPLEKLASLYLSNNQIKDANPLAKLTRLHALYLDGNQIENLTAVSGLSGLTILDARGCGVSDLSPLKGLSQWQYLLLDNNKIADLGPLLEMAEKDAAGDQRFAPFWRVYLAGNPLSEEAQTKQAARLKELGGRVFLDDNKQ